ncbi:MAG: transporter [Gammaproteobacteria bacterium]|nr:transporter [Gammaproteobacteria bacterium]MDP2141016.1 transporter [Gammaproteobacteria bacterium]MDP2349240.1 transporter [Gammaproteobacteria bacterium]
MPRRLFKYPVIASAAVCAVATAQETPDNSQRHNLSAGAYYSDGDYGQPVDTSIHYFPFAYDYTISNWNLKINIPHIEISGLGNVLVNVGGIGRNDLEGFIPSNPTALEASTTRGIGDTTLTATYQLPSYSATAPFIDLGFEVKLPTADEYRGLGTGELDFGIQVDLYQLIGEITLFGTVGYKFRGRSDLFNEMTDSAYVSLGFVSPIRDSLSYGVIYDFREAASENSMETHEILPFISWVPAPSWTLMTYIAKGFTRDSADIAIGAQLSYRW